MRLNRIKQTMNVMNNNALTIDLNCHENKLIKMFNSIGSNF